MRTAIAAVLRQFNAPLDTMRWATMSLSPASVADVRACRHSYKDAHQYLWASISQTTHASSAQVMSCASTIGPLSPRASSPAA